jgi:photosystem II stability/assembly factor-like uncharacterized protein
MGQLRAAITRITTCGSSEPKGSGAFQWTNVSPPFSNGYPALFYPPMDVLGSLIAKAGHTVFVSADSGSSWDEVILPSSGQDPPDLASAISIASPTRMYVGMVSGALYRISRGSSGWGSPTVVELTSPRRAFVSDIVVLGSSGQEIWTSCSEFGPGRVFRSQDGGVTWSNRSGDLPNIPINAIVVDPSDHQIVYAASDHGVYRTSNSGANWSDFSNGLPNAVVGDLILHEKDRLLRAGTRSRGAWEVGI